MVMTITPLQGLLRSKARSIGEVAQFTGRSRFTVRRWKLGLSVPQPDDARKLIELFGAEALDFNGCYQASVAVEVAPHG